MINFNNLAEVVDIGDLFYRMSLRTMYDFSQISISTLEKLIAYGNKQLILGKRGKTLLKALKRELQNRNKVKIKFS